MARKKGTLSKLLGTKSEYKGEKGRKRLIVKLVIYFIVWAGLLCSLVFSKDIDRGMNKKDFNFNESISAGEYKVHFIDVGQGDSSLIEFPDGKKMLIDTGEDSAENNLLRYLDSVNITTIDYLVLTHTDSDHIGNAEAVLENYDVLTVYMPTVYSTYDEENGFDTDPDYTTKETKVYSRVTEAVYKEGATVIRTFVGEDEDTPKTQPIVNEEYNYRVDFYAPYSETFSDSNDYSPVIMVRFGDLDGKGENGANLTVDFMFVGDLEEKGEEEFLEENSSILTTGELDCEILKVGHHGSSTSSSEEFLKVTCPEYAIISCGKDNKYGHPHDETIAKLEQAFCSDGTSHPQIMRTDELGSIVFGEGGTEPIAVQYNYNYVSDTYLQWKYFVILGGVILILMLVFIVKTKKKED